MRKVLLLGVGAMLFFICSTELLAQYSIAAAYNYPTTDSVLDGLQSIRCVNYAANPFGDGKPAIVATNYFDQGHVSVFVPVGNDSLELVWTSPTVTANGGGSTPRYALFGDLDNDGLVEVIYQSDGNGIYIYEWDGVAGSYNFGTQPSQVIDPTTTGGAMPSVTGNVEYMECTDVDGDGSNELLVAYNTSSNATDGYFIISGSGDWSTGSPGFSGFNVEYAGLRPNLSAWGLSGGSPFSMISGDYLGNGKKEILINNWDHNNITMMNVTGADSYALIDSSTGKQHVNLGGSDLDEVALFGGMAYDIDGDGRDEAYLPIYPATGTLGNKPHSGWVYMIHFDNESSITEIDTSKDVSHLDFSKLLPAGYPVFGYGYGDLDGNGKPNLYFSTSYPANVLSAEYEGGDKTDPNNWKLSVIYKGDTTNYTSITIKDSAGVSDTTRTVNTAFASKIYARNTDIFGDGHQEIILPYQTMNDSISIQKLTWNSTAAQYDTVNSMVLNPRRWSLRILEGGVTTGIQAKNVQIITPTDYSLEQNYPNPFNPSTKIRFSLPLTKEISLTVYDILGNKVKNLISNEVYQKGAHEVTWNGTNNYGTKVASGVYIYTLKFGNFSKSLKMTLLK